MVHRNRWIILSFLALSCLRIPSSEAQTPTPPATPGWVFSTAAGYSNVTNAPTNNGFANVTEFKLSEYLAIRGDVFIMNNPNIIGSYVGPEYILPATKIFKSGSPNSAVSADKVEFFFNA